MRSSSGDRDITPTPCELTRPAKKTNGPWSLALSRVVAMMCGVAGLAFLPASQFPDLDPLINLAPLFACMFAVFLAVILIFLRDGIVIAAAVLAFLGPASLIAPDALGALTMEKKATSEGARILKIISVNLWTLNRDFVSINSLIETEQPDVLIVQEAFGGWKPALERLAPTYKIVAGCMAGRHECNVVVLARLEAAAPPSPYSPHVVTAHLLLPDRLGGGAFEVSSVHLSRPPPLADQVLEIGNLERTATAFRDKAVIAGDFNATPWSTAIRRLDRKLPLRRVTHLLPSWPSPWPVAPIDHVYVGKAWSVSDVRLGPTIGSDHRPVIVALSIREPDTSGAQWSASKPPARK